jgi:hypothetical protein
VGDGVDCGVGIDWARVRQILQRADAIHGSNPGKIRELLEGCRGIRSSQIVVLIAALVEEGLDG